MATTNVVASKLSPVRLDISDDEDSYEPSNEDNADLSPEPAPVPTGDQENVIDPLDYIDHNHPLRPKRKSLILDAPKTLERFRYHAEFWFEVLLIMNKRAKMNQGSTSDLMLKDEVVRMTSEVQEAYRRREVAEAKVIELTARLAALQEKYDREQTLMAQLKSRPTAASAHNQRETRNHTLSMTPAPMRTTPEGMHDNPKFPDAPVFSGNRASFDAWTDKVRDKLSNSAAQYPTEYHRIAYIKSRTEGTAYQQIRAQCQPDHPRTFETAEELLTALEKIYGDKNRRSRAINELRTLRMGRKTFDDFYTDFARCAAEIGYSDDAVTPLLENAISDELAGQVIGLSKPSDYYDLVDFYREVDHQMRDYDKRVANRARSSRPASQTDRSRTARPTTDTNTRPEGYRPNATERALLAQHGRCYKCGEHGHRIGECRNPQMKEMPRLSARPQNKLNKATVGSDDDDDDKTIVEGKEES